MIDSRWVLGATAVAFVVHVLAAAAGYRLASQRESDSDATSSGRDVDCPTCGTTNEPGYRYCQFCMSELPIGSMLPEQPGRPVGGLLR